MESMFAVNQDRRVDFAVAFTLQPVTISAVAPIQNLGFEYSVFLLTD